MPVPHFSRKVYREPFEPRAGGSLSEPRLGAGAVIGAGRERNVKLRRWRTHPASGLQTIGYDAPGKLRREKGIAISGHLEPRKRQCLITHRCRIEPHPPW